ncbi:MAG: BON domain-containing protein [Acidobacteriota bacterium]
MLLRLVTFALFAAGLWAQNAPAPTAAPLDREDARIHDQVSLKLTLDTDVRGGGIQVEVKGGAVILRGRVKDLKAKEKATKLAKKIKGVTTIDNQLRLPDQK